MLARYVRVIRNAKVAVIEGKSKWRMMIQNAANKNGS